MFVATDAFVSLATQSLNALQTQMLMKNKLLMTGLVSALTVSVAGTIAPMQANQQPEETSTHSQSQRDVTSNSESGTTSDPAENVIKVGEQQSQDTEVVSEDVIAKIYEHQISGRKAVTLYVRDIPVATFLGAKVTPTTTEGAKVASSTDEGSLTGNQQADRSKDPIWRATTVAAKINQLYQSDVDADSIRVIWDKERSSYVLRAKDEHLLEIDETTIPPKTTRDMGNDALKITNLLRQQLGNASPLTEIPGRPQPAKSTVALGPVRFQLSGIASWYGPGFDGNLTANGERFNRYGMTAAHKSLPFGTQVRVTNLNNGRAVVVRINDRGPYIHGRIIDLSQGAAQAIGIAGVAPVRVDVLQ